MCQCDWSFRVSAIQLAVSGSHRTAPASGVVVHTLAISYLEPLLATDRAAHSAFANFFLRRVRHHY